MGFFKALLFLSSGLIIHILMDEQDLRKMGGLLSFFPVTYLFMLVASFSLIGFPYLSGFYSKEFILQYICISNFSLSFLFYHLAIFTIICTTFYSCRLLLYVFILFPSGIFSVYKKITMANYDLIADILFILFFLSIFSGYFLSDFFFGLGSTIFDGNIL